MQTAKAALSGAPLLAARPRATSSRRAAKVTPRAVAEPPTQAVPFTSDADHLAKWSSTSWRNYPALQQPAYPDEARSRGVAGVPTAAAACADGGGFGGGPRCLRRGCAAVCWCHT